MTEEQRVFGSIKHPGGKTVRLVPEGSQPVEKLADGLIASIKTFVANAVGPLRVRADMCDTRLKALEDRLAALERKGAKP